MTAIRRRTTCRVPGHGIRCEVAGEKATRYVRTTEERMALVYETTAVEVSPVEVEQALLAVRIRMTSTPVPAAVRERVLVRMTMRALEGAR